ncbi:MAG TPA: FHA domain-containing protein [Kofleriaceae bacterium]|nr:FHA domain-containing protein [Kofleriaceae bacterium]
MKRALLAVLLVLTSMLAGPSRALADDEAAKSLSYRAVVDRVELQPSPLGGQQLRVFLSALEIGGKQLELFDPQYKLKLYVGSGEKKVPYSLGSYASTDTDTALVVLVQASLDYAEALPAISDALDAALLPALSTHTQVVVLPFGETAATGKLGSVKQAIGKGLSTDNSAGDPALLDAIDRALQIVRKAKTEPEGRPLRKMIIVIGDGRDMSGDKERVTRTGTRAAKDGVRIHCIAFSSADIRRPMLALGELSKRSLGTFRWVRTSSGESWKAALEQLRDEINKQYVVTYFVSPEDDVAGHKMHIVIAGRIDATSNELKIPETPACGANECKADYCSADKCVRYQSDGGRGILGWLLLIGGSVVGLVVLLGVVGFFIQKAQQPKIAYPPGFQPPPGTPAPKPAKQKKSKQPQQPAGPPPGFLPNGRPMPAILITSGPRTGERHMLRNGYLIGKQPGCDLIIEDGYTSSQHAQIGMDPNGVCKLYDRGSTNGTYVQGVRITESALQHGTMIRIGSTEMRFLAE